MTGLVRKAMLFGVTGLLAASTALAGIPDPAQSTIPDWVYLVSYFGSGAPDVDGADGPAGTSNVFVIRDFAGNPISGVAVTITFPSDVRLCDVVPPAPYGTTYGQTASCPSTLNLVTDALGRVEFVAIGGSTDPGPVAPYFPIGPPYPVYAGGGFMSTTVNVAGGPVPFKMVSAIAIDVDGGLTTAGTTSLDVSKQIHNVNTFLAAGVAGTGNPQYRARADQNADATISALDTTILIGHRNRHLVLGTQGCIVGNGLCP